MDGRSSEHGNQAERLDVVLNVNLPRSLLARIDKAVSNLAARDPEITRAAWIRRALRDYLRRSAEAT